jgi:hypothetical protein
MKMAGKNGYIKAPMDDHLPFQQSNHLLNFHPPTVEAAPHYQLLLWVELSLELDENSKESPVSHAVL